jgi:sigma-B regulation protein RsbU (phosphoserine phosphatase)
MTPDRPGRHGADSAAARVAAAAGGARFVNIANNSRIPVLVEMSDALSRAVDPAEVLEAFSWRSEELYGPRGYVSISTRGLPPGHYRLTPVIRLDGSDQLAVADPLLAGDALPVQRGGFFGEIIRSSYPELIHHLKVTNDPVMGDALAPYGALMAIPLFDNGVPINWAIFLREDSEGFTIEDLERAILRSNLVGTAVKNALITKELREAHARIRGEIEHIASIQRALLPAQLPRIPGLRIATSYEVFDTAGGDYYDFRPLRFDTARGEVDPDGPWGILIADASGHGPSAAVLMAILQSIVHAYPADPPPSGPAELLEHANRQLARKRLASSFVTAFMAMYDPPNRRLVYARAGHHPPLLKDPASGDAVHRLEDVGGIPLGVLEETEYEQAEIELGPNQTLLLYTDGITEAMSPEGDMFGLAGIEHALRTCVGDADSMVASIMGPLGRHVGGSRPSDDQTIVAIQTE